MSGKISLVAAEREKRAVALRITGMSYEQIASDMQLANASVAWKIVQRALKRSVAESVDELRTLDAQRLDVLLAAIWDKAKEGRLFAVDRALLILQRRAELLGLDAPKKIAPTNPDGTEEYAALNDSDILRELARLIDLGRARAATPVDGGGALSLEPARQAEPEDA